VDSSTAIAWLTVALIGVTAFYAFQTLRLVQEMQKARAGQLLPKLSIRIYPIGAGNAFWRVINVGPGPAIGVDIQIAPEPGGQPRRWLEPVVMPGETHDFIPMIGVGQPSAALNLDNQTKLYSHLHLTGTYKDVFGTEHTADERFDLRAWWEFLKGAKHRFLPEFEEELPKRLKAMETQLGKIEGALKRS